jgi:hypothetical protein
MRSRLTRADVTVVEGVLVRSLYALNMILGRHPDLFFDVEADD